MKIRRFIKSILIIERSKIRKLEVIKIFILDHFVPPLAKTWTNSDIFHVFGLIKKNFKTHVTSAHSNNRSHALYLNKPEASLELVVTVTATIASTGTTYLTKNSYITSEIKWGNKFAECITPELQKKGPFKGELMYTVDEDLFDVLVKPEAKFYDDLSVCEYVNKYGCNNPRHEDCIRNWEKLIRQQGLNINDPQVARYRIECLAEPRYRLFGKIVKPLKKFDVNLFSNVISNVISNLFLNLISNIFHVGLHKSIYKTKKSKKVPTLKRLPTWKDAPSDAYGMTESEQTDVPDGKIIGHGDTTKDFFTPINEDTESEFFSEPVFNNSSSYSQRDVDVEPESTSLLLPRSESRNPIDGSMMSSARSQNRSKPRGVSRPTERVGRMQF